LRGLEVGTLRARPILGAMVTRILTRTWQGEVGASAGRERTVDKGTKRLTVGEQVNGMLLVLLVCSRFPWRPLRTVV
jgi:hypothetical protein